MILIGLIVIAFSVSFSSVGRPWDRDSDGESKVSGRRRTSGGIDPPPKNGFRKGHLNLEIVLVSYKCR